MVDEPGPAPIRIPADALVVLSGPSGSGKSRWADTWFSNGQVVSSDVLRGVVGEHEHDLKASLDAFDVLDTIVERRAARGLCTVVDTLGMDEDRLDRWCSIATRHDRPTFLIVFDVDPATCRKRNRTRPDPVPSKVLSAQLARWEDVKGSLGAGFDHVYPAAPAALVPTPLLASGAAAGMSMRFGLLISSFDWPGEREQIADRLGQIAAEAEAAGFQSIWVMDHFMQIPQLGREWEPMLESYTTLSFLAARTTRVRLGALVTCVTHRSLAHLGKIVATLDVLSGGRAECGLGLGWYQREHAAFGLSFPPVPERYDLLADALEFLPLLWGPGSPEYRGRRFSTPEAICYPRPLQSRIPILVGGSGERRTLRLVAESADACNLFGEPEEITHKVHVLEQHCRDVDRDPTEIQITQLSPILSGSSRADLRDRADALKASSESYERYAERATAGTTDEHIDRFGRLAEAGVDAAIVSLADVGFPESVLAFGEVIDALSP